MFFIQNLDNLLSRNKMSRSDLAKAIGLSPSTINAWFNRSCDNVSLKSLIKISEYFGVSIDELVNGEPIENQFTEREIQALKRLVAYEERFKK